MIADGGHAISTQAPRAETNADRAIDATLGCLAQFGASKTTIDDIAREAGMSRATLYRVFPGGKDALFNAAITREIGAFFDDLESRVGDVTAPEDLLTLGFGDALRFIRQHQSLSQALEADPSPLHRASFLTADDPAQLLITTFVGRYITDLEGDDAAQFCEVLVRLILSYATQPSRWVDPDDETSIRRLVRRHLIPALAT